MPAVTTGWLNSTLRGNPERLFVAATDRQKDLESEFAWRPDVHWHFGSAPIGLGVGLALASSHSH